MPAGYSGTPLPKKLGIKPHSVLALLDAPGGFARTLGKLPEGVQLRGDLRAGNDLCICFVRSQRELKVRIPQLTRRLGQHGVWIAWPKLSSKLAGDLRESDVRGAGLAAGLVDFKICAIDADWSGLKFQRRKG